MKDMLIIGANQYYSNLTKDKLELENDLERCVKLEKDLEKSLKGLKDQQGKYNSVKT